MTPGGDDIPTLEAQTPQAPQLPQEERGSDTEGYQGSHNLWGFYLIEVSEDHLTSKVVPLREVAQHFNVLFYLESSPCNDCVKIVNQHPQGGGVVDFGVQVRHPFPGQLYFTGFDVRGIAIFNAAGHFPEHDLLYSIASEGDGEVLNPDGFTHLYYVDTYGSGPNGFQGYIKGSMAGPKNPTGTLNAYKNYYSSENRHFFAAGGAKEIHYLIDLPQGALVFGYAVDANWAIPQNKPVDQVPDDFGLNANSPEAYQVSVTVGDTLTENTSQTNAEIWVYDWQGLDTIGSVQLEAPDLFSGVVDAAFDGLSSNYVVYKTMISNALGAAEGKYDMLVAVEDTENESAPDYLDLTAYQIAKVNVSKGVPNQPPVAIAHADKTEIKVGEEVNFDGSDSYDPEDGPVSLYKWDLDGDGVFNEGLGDATPSWVYNTPGQFTVDLEVWDSQNLTDTLDPPKIVITVTSDPCVGHTPNANGVTNEDNPNIMEEIEFTDISTDPDGFGDLAFFEWDLDGDHTNGPNLDGYETFSKNPKWTYTEGGDVLVYHRVTDNENCVDVMDDPITINVNGPPVVDAEADQYNVDVGTTVIFTSLSVDDDGNGPLTKWEWDLDNDGIYGDKTGEITSEQFLSPGTYPIGLKVTDAGGLFAELSPKLQIVVAQPADVVVHLDEEEAMNPVGASYVFFNRWGAVGGTSLINYLDYDGPWDFTGLFGNGVFYQDIINKNDSSVSGYNSNWPSVQYYIRQEGPDSLSGSPSIAVGATSRSYDVPPHDGTMYTYGVVDMSTGDVLKFNPASEQLYPLNKFTNQYFTYETEIPSLSLTVDSETWITALGQGTVTILKDSVPTQYTCLLLKVHQLETIIIDPLPPQTLEDVVSYRWIADDGTEIAGITALNSPAIGVNNWNSLTGLIEGNGNIRWLDHFDLGG